MTTILAHFAKAMVCVLIFLALSGGLYLRGQGWAVEFSQMDVFGLLLVLALLLLAFARRQSDSLFLQSNVFTRFANALLDKGQKRWIAPGLVFVFGFLFLGHWLRHMSFETNNYDMNCLHQPLFYPFEEVLFHCNVCRMNTQFAEHMVWILVPLSLVTMVLKSDVFLFVLQSLLVAIPLWIFITKGPLREEPKHGFWFFVLVALIYPLRNAMMWDFREDLFGFAFLLLAFTAFANKSWRWGTVLTLLVMTCKENFPAVTFLMGLVLIFERKLPLLRRERLIAGLIIMTFSVGSFILYHKFLIPYFMGPSEGYNNILRLFPGMGSTMSDFLMNVLKNPFKFLWTFGDRFFSMRSVRYMAMLIFPFVIWGWRAWFWAIPGIFMMMLNVMSQSDVQNSGAYHYELIIVPFLAMAVALGIQDASRTRTFAQLRGLWIWALSLALVVAGRGPVFEATDRLIYNWDRIPAHLQVRSWNIEGPLAATHYTIAQFNRVKELRTLASMRGPVPSDQSERIKQIVAYNRLVTIEEQKRDIRDAVSFALDLRDPWETAIRDELLALGGQQIETSQDARGKDYIVLVKLKEPPMLTWCRDRQICAEGMK